MRGALFVAFVLAACNANHAPPDLGTACGTPDHLHYTFSSTRSGFPQTASDLDVTGGINTLPSSTGSWGIFFTGAAGRSSSIDFIGAPSPGAQYGLITSGVSTQAGQAVLTYVEQNKSYVSMSGSVTIAGVCGDQLSFVVHGAAVGDATGTFEVDGYGEFLNFTVDGDRACSRQAALLSCGALTCPIGTWCDTSGSSPTCNCGDQPLPPGCDCLLADENHPSCGSVTCGG